MFIDSSRERRVPSCPLVMAALSLATCATGAFAGPFLNPYVPAEQRREYQQYLRSLSEFETVDSGDRFTDPTQSFISPAACFPPMQSGANGYGGRTLPGTGTILDEFEINPLDRDHEIYWSFVPDGLALEGCPPNVLHPELGFGQTQLPVTTANDFPSFQVDDMASALFLTLNGLNSPIGFGDLGAQVAWQTIVARAFDRWEEISGIEFRFVGGQEISAQPNPDGGNPWDVSASIHPPPMTGAPAASEGDIRIAMISLDGASSPVGGAGSILAWVYPVGVVPNADPTDMVPQMDQEDQVNCNWGYQGNILLDKEERWTDPATPDLFDIVMTRAIGQAIGLYPVCSADLLNPGQPGAPFSIMEFQPFDVPLPVLFFTELQPDDIRAVQNLYGDAFESNDGFVLATEIPVNLAPGTSSFTFAPHLMIPPDSEIETPLPLSIANGQSVRHQLDSNVGLDVDIFRLPVPVSETGGFLLDITVQPIGESTAEYDFDRDSDVTITWGECDNLGNLFFRPHLTQQDLRIRMHSFDPFTNTFVEVAFEDSTGAGSPEQILDFPVDDGVFYISVEGDSGPNPQMYNFTVEITRQVSESGLDVMPLLDLVEIEEFDTAGFTGFGANYAIIDGLLASEQHDTFGGQPRNTVAWSGAGAATTQVGTHATSVAALAIGDVNGGLNYRGVAPDANFFSASIASNVFADGSFVVSKSALYFALFGLTDPSLASSIGLPDTASVINSAFSGGGRALTGDDSISQAFDAAVSMQGVTIVAAAGNNGLADPLCRGVAAQDFDPGFRFLGSRSIVPPATAMNVISVGAAGTSDPANPEAEYDIVTNFSSRGPVDTTTFDGSGTINNDVRSGIDIVAPGTAITAIPPDFSPPGGTPIPRCTYLGAIPEAFLRVPSIDPADDPNNLTDTGFFAPAQGTSMASAVVAGAAALLHDVADANGYATHPAVIKAILLNGAEKLVGWTNVVGAAPAKPQDTRDGLDPAVVIILGATQPLDVAQGAGRLNFRRSLENFHTGYLPASEESFVFAGPPTIDPVETDPNIPTMSNPPDPNGTLILAAPDESSDDDASGSLTSTSKKDLSAAPVQDDVGPLSPIEIYHRLGQTMSVDRGQMVGRSLQFDFGPGKSGDLKPGRGPLPPPFTTGPTLPFIIPALGRTGPARPGQGGDFPGVPGSGQNGRFPRFIDTINVGPLGWDFGNIDQTTFVNTTGGTTIGGFIDYLIEVPLLPTRPDPQDQSMFLPADVLNVTLTWLREITVEGIDFRSPSDPRIGAVTALEHENLDLFVFLADAFGNPLDATTPIASSISIWSNVEHISFSVPQSGLYLIRVVWTGSNYDLFNNRPLAETQFGLAWRVDFSERLLTSASTFGVDDLVGVVDHWGGRGSNGKYSLGADATLDGRIDFNDLAHMLTHWREN